MEDAMIVMNTADVPKIKIETYPYKGVPRPVKEVWIQWLSKVGPEGSADYGLRFFTVGPGGEVPIHNHAYYQTTWILTGRLTVYYYDENDNVTGEKEMGPNDFVYIPTMETHSMKNPSSTEACTFLCCIANVRE
jgi:quercetin dioxygenase-like cupin family protein